MFDFSRIESPIELSLEFIFNKVTDEQIFRYYFQQNITLGKAYCSPFSRDRNPSTWFFRNPRGKLIFFDCRTSERLDSIGFVRKLYNCDFQQSLQQIAFDFGLIDRKTNKVSKQVFKDAAIMEKENKEKSLIQFIPDKWQKRHLDYWEQYEITKKELVEDNVYPVKQLFLNKKEIFNRENHLRFAYPEIWVEGGVQKNGVKIYSPYDKGMKHLSSIPLNIPFGINRLKFESDTLFITKSKKDAIILRKLFPDVIATQNESEASISKEVKELVLNRFKKRVIVWDNDETGVLNSKAMNSQGFGYFNIPKEEYDRFKVKDVSDYVRLYSVEFLKQLLIDKNLI